MTNEEIKAALSKLYYCKAAFTVTQTGKRSSRVNGLYKPFTQEICINNKNFTTDNQLMYTAIHELTHHILITEKGVKNAKSHSGIFWATFYDLVDKAIELKLYVRERSEETAALIAEAVAIQKQIIEAQKKLGQIILKLHESCAKNGERVEDVVEHDLQMSRNKAKTLMQNTLSGSKDNEEIAKAVNLAKDPMIKHAAQTAANTGKTVEQVKAIAKQKPKATDDDLGDSEKVDPKERLKQEEKRLKKTIAQLNNRLQVVQESLKSMGASDGDTQIDKHQVEQKSAASF